MKKWQLNSAKAVCSGTISPLKKRASPIQQEAKLISCSQYCFPKGEPGVRADLFSSAGKIKTQKYPPSCTFWPPDPSSLSRIGVRDD